MNIAIYSRQSIDKQDSISVETQINMCKSSECRSDDNVRSFIDKGFSGKNTNRPQFKLMMDEIKSGKIQKVVVYRLDRLSRSLVDFASMWQILDAYNVEFVSVSEKFDTTTPMGRAMIYIIMVFAQLERETISERVRDNYYERTKHGGWPGGPAPYGFDNGRIEVDGKSVPTLIPNDSIAIVKRIFDEYVMSGSSLGSIAKKLTEENVTSAKNAGWNNITVSGILKSPVYVIADINIYSYYKSKGITAFSNEIEEFDGSSSAMIVGKRNASTRKYSDFHNHTLALTNFEGIIPSEQWLECQYKLQRNRQLKNTGKGKYSWLTGLIKCKKCGYAAVVKMDYPVHKEPKPYLACSGRANKHVCEVKRIPLSIAELENIVENEIIKVISTFKETEEITDVKDANLKMKLLKIDEQIDKLIETIACSEELTVTYLNRKIATLDKERQKVLTDIEKRNKTNKNILESIDFTKLDMSSKHMVAEQFIVKVLVADDEVEIVWKV